MSRVVDGQDYPRPATNASAGEKALADIDSVFGALAHATRRHILLVLRFRGGRMTAGEIAGRFDCSWPTVTRHLKVLREAGLVVQHRDGRERIYELAGDRLNSVAIQWLRWFIDDETPDSEV